MSPRILLIGIALLATGTVSYAYLSPPAQPATAPAANTQASQPSAQPTTQPATQSNTGSAPSTSSGQTGTASSYTMATVAKHNSASSCWTTISGKVYDLTQWIDQHPGGPGPILSLCGTDGTAAFNAQHGGQGRPANELASLFIGTLK